jgi:MFS family permease
MYVAESTRVLVDEQRAGTRRGGRVARIVVLLGLTSLFTDISAEMVSTVLPVYVVFGLGAAPIAFGLLDGLYQGASSLVRLASGVVSDRGGHKAVAVSGYGLSALTRVGLILFGGTVPGLAALIFADRTGKGIRTAPRDAMISLATPKEELGRAFGVHRALDTAGALLGPLIAVGVLLLAPRRYDAVFVVSLAFALIGLAILVLYVHPSERPRRVAPEAPRATIGRSLSLLRDPRFRSLTVAGALLALMTVSDGFIYLGLQRHLGFKPTLLPLLYVGTALVYMVLAVPVGRLADRVGRAPVFIAGYGLLMLVYSALLLPHMGVALVAVYLAAFGAFYAATDGVLAALTSVLVPEHLRASGLALLVAVTSLGRLVGSLLFGLAWTVGGLQWAVAIFAIGLALAIAGAIGLLAAQARRA